MSKKRHALVGGLAALVMAATTAVAMAAPAVATASVNVRSGPGTSYRVVDVLSRGQQVEIERCQGNWCYVTKRGPDGWVSANYLARTGPSPRPPSWQPAPPRPPVWNPRPPRPPVWNPRPPRPPYWNNPRPPRQDGFCFSGPNGFFCVNP